MLIKNAYKKISSVPKTENGSLTSVTSKLMTQPKSNAMAVLLKLNKVRKSIYKILTKNVEYIHAWNAWICTT